MKQIIWFRSDLRVQDNTALNHAMRMGPTIALYIVTPKQWVIHEDADCKIDFWLRNLSHLKSALEKLGVPLLIRHCSTWDKTPEIIHTLCQQQAVRSVHVNDEHGTNEILRDQQVAARLKQGAIEWRNYLDQLFSSRAA